MKNYINPHKTVGISMPEQRA